MICFRACLGSFLSPLRAFCEYSTLQGLAKEFFLDLFRGIDATGPDVVEAFSDGGVFFFGQFFVIVWSRIEDSVQGSLLSAMGDEADKSGDGRYLCFGELFD